MMPIVSLDVCIYRIMWLRLHVYVDPAVSTRHEALCNRCGAHLGSVTQDPEVTPKLSQNQKQK